ncbi:UNVERIFIED_CONTAM: hypothetical protein HDU68_001191 [Siphonaria sp. JEL0065]|nr:hypothetical protein HDU68_001191 [Siphonaria sp. JEL0065]
MASGNESPDTEEDEYGIEDSELWYQTVFGREGLDNSNNMALDDETPVQRLLRRYNAGVSGFDSGMIRRFMGTEGTSEAESEEQMQEVNSQLTDESPETLTQHLMRLSEQSMRDSFDLDVDTDDEFADHGISLSLIESLLAISQNMNAPIEPVGASDHEVNQIPIHIAVELTDDDDSASDPSSASQQQQQNQHIGFPMFEQPTNASIQPPLDPPPPKQKAKRKKVSQACVFCRRSHMTCGMILDVISVSHPMILRAYVYFVVQMKDGLVNEAGAGGSSTATSTSTPPGNGLQPQLQNLYAAPMHAFTTNQQPDQPFLQSQTPTGISHVLGGSGSGSGGNTLQHGMSNGLFPPLFAGGDSMGNELTIISDFLASLETPAMDINKLTAGGSSTATRAPSNTNTTTAAETAPVTSTSTTRMGRSNSVSNSSVTSETKKVVAQPESLSSTERFVLTAADPMTIGSNEDRLNQVISAKFEAGLLKPYNYINSYKKLNTWMETHMSPASRTRILNVMGLFRPRFQWVAQRLTDMDLVLVEEAFERMLLEYDRVFSSMGIPSCLWRRTGEIWKCNKEFAELVGLPMEDLKDGKLSIYELMSEESAVNYWEKYGNIAFDAGQKAILTSCILKKPDEDGASAAARTLREGVSCCFSFTIRRDRYSIPIIIAGNFLPVMD